jgi:hypothetical protein
MKRLIIAIVAIGSAFLISFIGFFSVQKTCDKLEAQLIKICETAQKQDRDEALKKSEELIILWDDIHGVIESFVDHDETDKLEETIRNLPTFAHEGNMERLYQQADLAIDELGQIVRGEKPIISNIF